MLHAPLLLPGLLLGAEGLAAIAQQNSMTRRNTNASARSLKGDERVAFMSQCLKAAPAQTQQEKMKTCNATATAHTLKGDARNAFMSDCLKKK